MTDENRAAAGGDAEGTTALHRAFNAYRKMHPQPGAARDLSDWLNVSIECAYAYVKRLKELGCLEPKGGTGAVPLYGLTDLALQGIAVPPPDNRGRPRVQIDAAWGGRGR